MFTLIISISLSEDNMYTHTLLANDELSATLYLQQKNNFSIIKQD